MAPDLTVDGDWELNSRLLNELDGSLGFMLGVAEMHGDLTARGRRRS